MQSTAPPPPYINKITLYNGCSIAYTDEGSGAETLLFIHGLGTYSGTWQKNIAALHKSYRCIAIDLPGNGYSATGDYPYTMDFFARSVIDFIGRMGLSSVTLVGHSMGGQIALTATLLAPACCDKIILCAPAGFETFTMHEQMMYKASLSYASWLTSNEEATRHLLRASFNHFPEDAADLLKSVTGLIKRQPPRHYQMMTDRCMTSMIAAPVFARLKLIQKPVLVMFGEKDALIPNTLLHPSGTRRVGEAGIAQLKHGTLHMMRDCGHFVQWECAVKVNRLIAAWMKTASV